MHTLYWALIKESCCLPIWAISIEEMIKSITSKAHGNFSFWILCCIVPWPVQNYINKRAIKLPLPRYCMIRQVSCVLFEYRLTKIRSEITFFIIQSGSHTAFNCEPYSKHISNRHLLAGRYVIQILYIFITLLYTLSTGKLIYFAVILWLYCNLFWLSYPPERRGNLSHTPLIESDLNPMYLICPKK